MTRWLQRTFGGSKLAPLTRQEPCVEAGMRDLARILARDVKRAQRAEGISRTKRAAERISK